MEGPTRREGKNWGPRRKDREGRALLRVDVVHERTAFYKKYGSRTEEELQ